jgi:hypothetical protein
MQKFFLAVVILLCCMVTFAQPKKNSNPASGFKAVLNGKWISTKYLETLAATKSPLKAQEAGNAMMQLFVNSKEVKNNSIYADGWTLHEGGYGFIISFKPGIKKNTFKTDYNDPDKTAVVHTDIGFDIKGKDSSLILYHYSAGKKLLGTTTFKKTGAPANIANEQFLAFVVNKTLFTGSYTGTDSAGNTLQVSCTNDGRISGLRGFAKYNAVTDILQSGEGDYYDEMYLTGTDGRSVLYAFKIEGNRWLLYGLHKTGEGPMALGPLQYALTRK